MPKFILSTMFFLKSAYVIGSPLGCCHDASGKITRSGGSCLFLGALTKVHFGPALAAALHLLLLLSSQLWRELSSVGDVGIMREAPLSHPPEMKH